MKRKALAARTERNRRLALEDAKNRCGLCKIALSSRVHIRWGDPAEYCSAECLKQVNDRDGRPW